MREVNLVLHAGGNKVERTELVNVITPDGTETWQPIPHSDLLDSVEESLTGAGLSIISEAHALARDGNRYFGLLQVGWETDVYPDSLSGDYARDYSLVVGVRNSHDKSFPAALCLGSQVFVCDNLAFSGEVKLARKHTRYINRDLPQLVARAVGELGAHRVKQDQRILAYKGVPLSDLDVHDFLIRSLDAKVIGPCALPDVLDCWRKPLHDEFAPRTAWSLFNAFTETLKGNVTQAFNRTTALHGLMDSECKVVLAG